VALARGQKGTLPWELRPGGAALAGEVEAALAWSPASPSAPRVTLEGAAAGETTVRVPLTKVAWSEANCVAPLRPLIGRVGQALFAQMGRGLRAVGQELRLRGGIAAFADTLACLEGRLSALGETTARHQAEVQDLLRVDGRLLADLLASATGSAIGLGHPRSTVTCRSRRWPTATCVRARASPFLLDLVARRDYPNTVANRGKPGRGTAMQTASASPLMRLRLPDQPEAWAQFVRLYAPMLSTWARHLGLRHADAAVLPMLFSGGTHMSGNWLRKFVPTNPTRRRASPRPFRPRVEAMESRLVPSQFFEAEGKATLGGIGPYFDGGAIHDYPRVEDVRDSGHTGHDGCCYVNLAYSDDSTITWDNVVEDQAGDYTVAFRYSMNTYYSGAFIPDRPMGLMVNGDVITRVLDFQATGDSTLGGDPWSVWADFPVTVRLNAGVNTVELFATDLSATGANPHVDSMTVTPVPPGVAPAAPANFTASAVIGDVDLNWEPSAIASSYNIYRSTSSGTETRIAGGVTANYFFDTGLAGDGTTYFYRVSAVNAAGESALSDEASATPVAPPGLLFSDDFSNGPSPAWVFTPEKDYWLPQVGLLTDAKGDTVANVPQTATVALPAGAGSWQADLLTKEGYGAAVDRQGNPGISGISVQSGDGANAVLFSVFPDFTVNVGTTVQGVWQGWARVGRADPVMHRGGPEMLWHSYDIQLDAGGTFSAIFDGRVLRSGIGAGPASAWADGIGTGTLFTLSNLNERHLSTFFDNVRSFELAGAPNTRTDWPAALAHYALSDGTIYVHQVAAVRPAGERGYSNEVPALAQAVAPDAAANLSAKAGDGQVRLGRASATPLRAAQVAKGSPEDGLLFQAMADSLGADVDA
jgi:hypothetical protein